MVRFGDLAASRLYPCLALDSRPYSRAFLVRVNLRSCYSSLVTLPFRCSPWNFKIGERALCLLLGPEGVEELSKECFPAPLSLSSIHAFPIIGLRC